ncbi:hypothetical protein MCERE10_01811 [Burkholderiaceae bacterium]
METNKGKKGKQLPFDFLIIPKEILEGAEYQQLPHSSIVLMFYVMYQFKGKNNGRLTPSLAALEKMGWTSKSTLLRAKKALLETSFVVMTRRGHPPRTCEWWGFTWWKLDWVDSMDIQPRDFPYLNFLDMRSKQIDPNHEKKNASRSTKSGAIDPQKPPFVVPNQGR